MDYAMKTLRIAINEYVKVEKQSAECYNLLTPC